MRADHISPKDQWFWKQNQKPTHAYPEKHLSGDFNSHCWLSRMINYQWNPNERENQLSIVAECKRRALESGNLVKSKPNVTIHSIRSTMVHGGSMNVNHLAQNARTKLSLHLNNKPIYLAASFRWYFERSAVGFVNSRLVEFFFPGNRGTRVWNALQSRKLKLKTKQNKVKCVYLFHTNLSKSSGHSIIKKNRLRASFSCAA